MQKTAREWDALKRERDALKAKLAEVRGIAEMLHRAWLDNDRALMLKHIEALREGE